MASGIEMMLKALGIDPQEFIKAVTETIGRLQHGIREIDSRMSSIDRGQAETNARLERLEKHLGVEPEAETDETPRLRISRQ